MPSWTSHSASRHRASRQPVGHESVDFRAHPQRRHARSREPAHRSLDRQLGGLLPRDNFDQRQQVHRIERMPDDQARGMCHPGLQLGRGGCPTLTRRSRHPAWPQPQSRHRRLLGLQTLGCALMHEHGVIHGPADVCDYSDVTESLPGLRAERLHRCRERRPRCRRVRATPLRGSPSLPVLRPRWASRCRPRAERLKASGLPSRASWRDDSAGPAAAMRPALASSVAATCRPAAGGRVVDLYVDTAQRPAGCPCGADDSCSDDGHRCG